MWGLTETSAEHQERLCFQVNPICYIIVVVQTKMHWHTSKSYYSVLHEMQLALNVFTVHEEKNQSQS